MPRLAGRKITGVNHPVQTSCILFRKIILQAGAPCFRPTFLHHHRWVGEGPDSTLDPSKAPRLEEIGDTISNDGEARLVC